jgi:site-specific recombinase XerD
MCLDYFFSDFTEIRTFRSLTKPPLAPWIERHAEFLRQEGYAMQTAREQLRMLGRLNDWLDTHGGTSGIVEPVAFEGFRDHLRQLGKLRKGYESVLQHLLRLIRPDLFVYTPTAIDVLLQGFRDYLLNERGLARTTVRDWSRIIQNFLERQVPGGSSGDLSGIQPDLLADWVKQQAGRACGYGKHVITALRSFLSYAYYRNLIDRNLAVSVPGGRTWSLLSLPKHLCPEQVQKVLDCCDESRRSGKRDLAILLLLARLGLRAGEVAAIRFEDIDWDSGIITVRGKTRRTSRLPLSQEVGEAIAAYLHGARPKCKARQVFVTSRAPYRPFTKVGGISAIATRALKDAGINVGRNGAHVFRHSLATTMLRNGASLGEIGEILRHRRADTTAIYAKVDLPSLRSLAMPWPGGPR